MCAKFFDFYEQLNKPRAQSQPPAPASTEAMTISQLTSLIDGALRDCLPPSLLVRGEVSNFNHHRGSGHAYFTLKDSDACIDCVMFKSDFSRVKFTPQDGMELLARGRIGIYPQRGRYQLYVSRLDPLGQGALELAFKQLCAKLEREGLFAPERKKSIPAYPLRLALLTSTQTAALQDMLKVLRRFPWLRLFIYHVPVQGDGSAERMAEAIAELARSAASIGGIDLILLGRGGGSLEDLWEFNEELLARAIVASPIPIISGVGHEVDVTIADLVADLRAHTPTEAAQVAVANWRTAADVVDALSTRLRRELRNKLTDARNRLASVERHTVFRRPLDRINSSRQFLDDRQRLLLLGISARVRRLHARLLTASARLEQHRPAALLMRLRDRLAQNQQTLIRAATIRLRTFHDRLNRLAGALRERHPRHAIELYRQRLDQLEHRLRRAMSQTHQRQLQRIASLAAHLNAIGPQQVLKRGYTITTLRKTARVVKSATDLKVGDRIITQFADGTAQSIVEDQRQLPLFE